MNIREIEVGDIPELFRVRIATWHNPDGASELAAMGITNDSVALLIEKGSHKGWLCEDSTEVVGFAMGNRESGEIWVIAVLKSHENQGIGKALLSRVEEWLALCGWEELWLTTDTDDQCRAVGFYRHLGWQDWKIQDGDRFMRKSIDNQE